MFILTHLADPVLEQERRPGGKDQRPSAAGQGESALITRTRQKINACAVSMIKR
jgi:hypothetical protein